VDKEDFPFPIIPTYGRKNGEDCLATAAKKYNPHILWTFHDVQWVRYITNPDNFSIQMAPEAREFLKHKNRNFVHLGYFPIDGMCKDNRLPKPFDTIIKGMDVPVTCSRFTKKAVDDELGLDIPMIYHGIDTKKFFPMDAMEARKKLGIPEDRFVVGMIAANQERKLFEDLIPAFARFCRDKPEANLLLFTDLFPRDFYGSHDLIDLMNQYDVMKRFIDISPFLNCDDLHMNYFYNAIDVGVLCTQGEGFGLPIIHHHAVGRPVLASDNTSCTEMTVHPVERLKHRSTLISNGNNLVRFLTDIEDLAEKLEMLYHNPDLREEIGRLGMERVKKDFEYDTVIMPQWRELLARVEKDFSHRWAQGK
jgi:glycosyltransferase involved in cell wall biosynthesis